MEWGSAEQIMSIPSKVRSKGGQRAAAAGDSQSLHSLASAASSAASASLLRSVAPDDDAAELGVAIGSPRTPLASTPNAASRARGSSPSRSRQPPSPNPPAPGATSGPSSQLYAAFRGAHAATVQRGRASASLSPTGRSGGSSSAQTSPAAAAGTPAPAVPYLGMHGGPRTEWLLPTRVSVANRTTNAMAAHFTPKSPKADRGWRGDIPPNQVAAFDLRVWRPRVLDAPLAPLPGTKSARVEAMAAVRRRPLAETSTSYAQRAQALAAERAAAAQHEGRGARAARAKDPAQLMEEEAERRRAERRAALDRATEAAKEELWNAASLEQKGEMILEERAAVENARARIRAARAAREEKWRLEEAARRRAENDVLSVPESRLAKYERWLREEQEESLRMRWRAEHGVDPPEEYGRIPPLPAESTPHDDPFAIDDEFEQLMARAAAMEEAAAGLPPPSPSLPLSPQHARYIASMDPGRPVEHYAGQGGIEFRMVNDSDPEASAPLFPPPSLGATACTVEAAPAVAQPAQPPVAVPAQQRWPAHHHAASSVGGLSQFGEALEAAEAYGADLSLGALVDESHAAATIGAGAVSSFDGGHERTQSAERFPMAQERSVSVERQQHRSSPSAGSLIGTSTLDAREPSRSAVRAAPEQQEEEEEEEEDAQQPVDVASVERSSRTPPPPPPPADEPVAVSSVAPSEEVPSTPADDSSPMPAEPDPDESLLFAGIAAIKLPRKSGLFSPRLKRVTLTFRPTQQPHGGLVLAWDNTSKKSADQFVDVSELLAIVRGEQSAALKNREIQKQYGGRSSHCFTLVLPNRSLDVVIVNESDADAFERVLKRHSGIAAVVEAANPEVAQSRQQDATESAHSSAPQVSPDPAVHEATDSLDAAASSPADALVSASDVGLQGMQGALGAGQLAVAAVGAGASAPTGLASAAVSGGGALSIGRIPSHHASSSSIGGLFAGGLLGSAVAPSPAMEPSSPALLATSADAASATPFPSHSRSASRSPISPTIERAATHRSQASKSGISAMADSP